MRLAGIGREAEHPAVAHWASTSTETLIPCSRRGRRLGVDRLAHGGHRRRALGRLDQELAALAAAEPKARRRAERDGAVRQRRVERLRAAPAAAPLQALGVGRRELDPDQVRERRIAELAAALELAGEEARRRRGAAAWRDRVGARAPASARAPGPPRVAAAAAAGELGDEREGPLLGAQVGKAQGRVGVEDDAEHDVGEVVALGDHLGADQDAGVRLPGTRRRISRCPPARAVLSASRRKTGSGATAAAISSSIRSAAGAGAGERHRAAVGARARAAARRGRSGGSAAPHPPCGRPARRRSCGHSAAQPQARQVR